MIKGWKKLNKKQIRHLVDSACNNTTLFQRTINAQAGGIPCFDCEQIARVLGMTPEPHTNLDDALNGRR
jgi:hypothetical protein